MMHGIMNIKEQNTVLGDKPDPEMLCQLLISNELSLIRATTYRQALVKWWLSEGSGFDLTSVCLGFVVNIGSLLQVFLAVFVFFVLGFISPMLHMRSAIYLRTLR